MALPYSTTAFRPANQMSRHADAQREGDVLRLRWSNYDGEVIRLKQRKGQRRGKKNAAAIVIIPVAEPLKAALDAEFTARKEAKVSPLKIEEQVICLNSEGEPWREGRDGYIGFISSFRKAKERAGIEGVNFSDLRGTAVTRERNSRHAPRTGRVHGPRDLRHHRPQPRRGELDPAGALPTPRPEYCLECNSQVGSFFGQSGNRGGNRNICSSEENGEIAMKSNG
jgi:integrase